MCSEYFDEGEDQRIRDEAAAAARAKEMKKLQEQQKIDTSAGLVAAAIDADRRRGRRATIVSGVTGDPTFGAAVNSNSAYSLAIPAGATRLGG